MIVFSEEKERLISAARRLNRLLEIRLEGNRSGALKEPAENIWESPDPELVRLLDIFFDTKEKIFQFAAKGDKEATRLVSHLAVPPVKGKLRFWEIKGLAERASALN